MLRGKASSVLAALMMLFSAGLILIVGAQNASAQYTSHDPILIVGDGDFKPVNGVKGGSGTQANPYRIEGWEIWGSDTEACVEVRDTTAHFIIRDCSLQIGDGVVMLRLSNGTVSGITTYACTNHVRVENSTDVRIELSTLGGSGRGICVKNSTNVSVIANSMDVLSPAIHVETSSRVDTSDNHANTANDCIDILNSTEVTCTNDTWAWVTHRGVLIDHSSLVTVDGCSFKLTFADGASVVGSNNCTIIGNNFTTDNPYYWMEGVAVILSECDNVSAESNSMMYRSTGVVVSRSVNSFLFNNTITTASIGISEGNSSSSLLANNTLTGVIQGILSTESVNCTLISDKISARDAGIYMRESNMFSVIDTSLAMYGLPLMPFYALECNDSLIYGNTGLSPGEIVVEKCLNMTLMNNSLSGDAPLGIRECTGTMVVGNYITYNTAIGIYVYSSYDTYIAWNTLNATGYCIYLDGCVGGQAFGNLFPERNLSSSYGIQASYVHDYEIWGNEFHDCDSGVGLSYCSNVTVYWNEMYDSSITLYESPENFVMNNTFWGSSGVSAMYNCTGTMILGNEFPENGTISLNDAIGLFIMENIFDHNGVEIWGSSFEAYDYHLITPDNLVNGNPIIQVTDSMDVEISDMTVGQLIVVNCGNVSISNVVVNGTNTGILIAFCLNTTLENNTISNNSIALRVYYSLGILVHHNRFIDNVDEAWIDTADISFNLTYPGGGNYWSDYTGVDLMHGPLQNIPGADGFGDAAYDRYGPVDYYPIVGAFIDYPPRAFFSASTTLGDLSTEFVFDAGISVDDEGSALVVRWDWNGDGTWDTNWSSNMTVVHTYTSIGTYTVKLEIMDSHGNTNTTEMQVVVVEVIPEFNMLGLVAVLAGMSIIVVGLWRLRGSKRQKES